MKKIYLSILSIFALATVVVGQQEIETIDAPEQVNVDASSFVEEIHVFVKNNTDNTLEVWVSRTNVDTLTGTDNYFCWDQCYTPPLSDSPVPVEILPGDTVGNFRAYYNPNNQVGASTVQYCFYTQDGSEFENCFSVDWVSESSGIGEVENQNQLGNAIPNPATDRVAIEYKSDLGQADLAVYNLVGSVVKEVDLQNNDGRVELDVSDLSPGVYVYSLQAGNRTIASKKLSIIR